MIKNISNLGDAALYCDFGKEVNRETNTQVIKYFKTIRKKNILGVNNITPSYNKLIISFDLKKINFNKLKNSTHMKVIALGGISKFNERKIYLLNCFGISGISYFE